MKTIGVLGGLGPQATNDFVDRVHRASNRLIPARFNTGYPPMVVHYHRSPPVVMADARTPKLPMEVDGALLEAAAWLGGRADFLVIPANAPHLFASEIERSAGKPLLSLIDVTLAEVKRRGWKAVGVLGFGDPNVPVYSVRLRAAGVRCETIDAALQQRLNAAVIRIQEGRPTVEDAAVMRDAVGVLRGRGVDGVIPGCTEIPFLLGDAMQAADLVNPAELLAEAAVRRVMVD